MYFVILNNAMDGNFRINKAGPIDSRATKKKK